MEILRRRKTLASRLYACLAFVLPVTIRRTHRTELLETFDDELNRARTTGGLGHGVLFSLRASMDVIATGVKERARRWRRAASPPGGPGKPRLGLIGSLGRDAIEAWRSLRRRPAMAVAATCIMSLGVSASVAVFTYVNAFSQAPPGVDPDGLVQVHGVTDDDPSVPISFPDFVDYTGLADRSFNAIAAVYSASAASVRSETITDVALLEAVSGQFFETFGARTIVGRPLQPEDDLPGAGDTVVISHRWWRRAFDGDPAALGQTIFLNGRPHTLVGVMAPDFLGSLASFRADVWVPFVAFRARYTGWDAQAKIRERPLVRVYGRLRAGVGEQSALNDLERTSAGLDEQYPQDHPRRLRLADATWIDPSTRADEQQTVQMMSAAALGLALLVAANVANLLLAGASGRRREFAVRIALGASRGRLLRQNLLEHLLLSVGAGGVALLLAGPLSARLGSYFARPSVWGNNVAREVVVDPRVWIFALGFTLVMGLLTGWLPAWRASRERFSAVMGRAPEGTGRLTHRRLPDTRGTLVAAQVALAVVLVVVAGLVLRTLNLAAGLEPGFDYQRSIASYISTSSTTIPEESRNAFYIDLGERLTEEPWVRSATVADAAPLSPHASARIRIEGRSEPESVVSAQILPSYLATLGIGITRGRNLSVNDSEGAPDVALLNEVAAARLFPDVEPVGRRLWRGATDDEREYRVVGVVADAKIRDFFAAPEPVVYFSAPQHPHSTTGALIVAVEGDPAAAVPVLERWLRNHESRIAIVNAIPYAEVLRGVLYVQRMNAELFSVLACLGLILSTVGVFSVMALMARQRTREIGIRMAVGAQASQINRMVIRDALVPITLGLVVGGLAAIGAKGVIGALLFGVEPTDPVATLGGLAVVLLAAVSAAYVPARRAARVDPVLALRD